MREGVTLMRDQSPFQMSLVFELLAEEVAAGGGIEDALTILDDAFAEIERMGHHAYTAEVHRTLGVILLRRNPADIARAEEAFTRALEIARRRQTKTFEFRAALALARLYCATDRASAARDLLEPVIVSFDGGPELPELAEAKRLVKVKLTGGT
jgi:predicted ATPase